MNEYRRLSRKQWAWTTAIAFLLAIAAGGITLVYYWPQYEAQGVLGVYEVPTMPIDHLNWGAILSEQVPSEQISPERIRDILASRGTTRDRLTQMWPLVNLPQRDWSGADLESALRDCDAIEELSRELDIPPAALRQGIESRMLGNGRVILVSYRSSKREIPAQVVNSVVQSVVQSAIEEERRERREIEQQKRERLDQIRKVGEEEIRQCRVDPKLLARLQRYELKGKLHTIQPLTQDEQDVLDILEQRIQSPQLYRDEMERPGADPGEIEAHLTTLERMSRCVELSRVVPAIGYRLDADHGPSPPFRCIQRAATPPPKPSRSEVIPLVSLTAFCVSFVFLGIVALWQNWRRGWRQQFGLKALLLLALFVAVLLPWISLTLRYRELW